MPFFRKNKKESQPEVRVFGPVEYVICGLGNPGDRYGNTRHNTGYCALDVLAMDLGVRVDRIRFHAVTGEAMLDGRHIVLMKPTTYMNLSGEAVHEAMTFYKLPPERLIVLSDDVSLPVGRMRIRPKGSAGGHNGLKNIICHLGSEEFPRIRFGVGEKPDPGYDLADWVLGKFTEEEGRALLGLFRQGKEAVSLIMAGKIADAMSRFN